MDLFSQDKEIETIFHGSNENTAEFLRRAFDGACGIITDPKRLNYIPEDLCSTKYNSAFDVTDKDFVSNGVVLHVAAWTRRASETTFKPLSTSSPLSSHSSSTQPPSSPSPSSLCLIYLHTNSRNIVDAKEILPLADALMANVIAFDFPGAGLSGGAFTISPAALAVHLHNIITWAETHLAATEFVLWARGMSTAIAVEYLARQQHNQRSRIPQSWSSNALKAIIAPGNTSSRLAGHFGSSPNLSQMHAENSKVKFCVLDSPYTGVRDLMDTMADKIRCTSSSFSISSPLIAAGCWLMRRSVSSKLGTHLDTIAPINNVRGITTPVLILSAKRDDYIPVSHGERFRTSWGNSYAHFHVIDGGHFGERPESVVMLALDHIQRFIVSRCPSKGGSATSSSLKPDCDATGSANSHSGSAPTI